MMVCSWCNCTIVSQVDGNAIPHSHGICKACAKRELAEGIKAARELRAYERERDQQAAPIGHDERTLSALYGVPLHLSSVF